jgi:RimJ/RimL family protein N-acetyltransferase
MAPTTEMSICPADLSGRFVRLEPLSLRHSNDLWEAIGGGANEALWTYLPIGPFATPAEFDGFVAEKTAATDAHWLAIIDKKSGRPAGVLALMRIDTRHRVIEVGGVILSPGLQRTPASTEAQYLLARHAFETLRFRRYEWKCDNRNEPSKRAAERLGFTFEGVFRQHMMVRNQNRDTTWFSMLDGEWPSRKTAFEAWLDETNFDAAGRQKVALSSLRKGRLDNG